MNNIEEMGMLLGVKASAIPPGFKTSVEWAKALGVTNASARNRLVRLSAIGAVEAKQFIANCQGSGTRPVWFYRPVKSVDKKRAGK